MSAIALLGALSFVFLVDKVERIEDRPGAEAEVEQAPGAA
ncbi:hypothetical protein FHX42_001846 [Saccharopolyspora lacisalsi]|uniref:Uncharacterized protein n=1 Tax=Halosaccharopolyspora lacisalsi TaxID=1000566 RepID=A0A839DUR5_9PSEU|nr:hypothetical protein [Halosaccharopolyspora lacisalsi]